MINQINMVGTYLHSYVAQPPIFSDSHTNLHGSKRGESQRSDNGFAGMGMLTETPNLPTEVYLLIFSHTLPSREFLSNFNPAPTSLSFARYNLQAMHAASCAQAQGLSI